MNAFLQSYANYLALKLITNYTYNFQNFSEPTPLNILVGTHDINTGGKLYESVDVNIHMSFKDKVLGAYDIALVLTSTRIQFCEFVQPIALAKINPLVDPPNMYHFAGWGATTVV